MAISMTSQQCEETWGARSFSGFHTIYFPSPHMHCTLYYSAFHPCTVKSSVLLSILAVQSTNLISILTLWTVPSPSLHLLSVLHHPLATLPWWTLWALSVHLYCKLYHFPLHTCTMKCASPLSTIYSENLMADPSTLVTPCQKPRKPHSIWLSCVECWVHLGCKAVGSILGRMLAHLGAVWVNSMGEGYRVRHSSWQL